jgi:hypothetical protein
MKPIMFMFLIQTMIPYFIFLSFFFLSHSQFVPYYLCPYSEIPRPDVAHADPCQKYMAATSATSRQG